MDPATKFAAIVAAAGAAYLVLGAVLDGVRRLAGVRLAGLPSLRPLLAAMTVVSVLGRVAPAAAALPPPAYRLTPGHGSRVAAALVAQPGAAPGPTPAADYEVVAGDTLWDIARRTLGAGATAADIGTYWRAIYAANAGVVGDDPDLIHPGQTLDLPDWP